MYRNFIQIRAAAGCLGHSGQMGRDEVAQDEFARPGRKLRGTVSAYFQRPSGWLEGTRIGARRAFMSPVKTPDDYRSALTVIYYFAGAAVCLVSLFQLPGSYHADFVYFPLSGVVSLLSSTQAGEMVEVGMIGNEGTTFIPVIAHSQELPYRMLIQAPGEALQCFVQRAIPTGPGDETRGCTGRKVGHGPRSYQGQRGRSRGESGEEREDAASCE